MDQIRCLFYTYCVKDMKKGSLLKQSDVERRCGGVPSVTLTTDTVFPLRSHRLKGENLGTSVWVPLREENLSALNWISIFNQLARKATKQVCAYARSLGACCV